MKSEELEQLLERIHHSDTSSDDSIGLHNIAQRIRLCYKEQALLTIESAFGKGTLITLKLPAESIG